MPDQRGYGSSATGPRGVAHMASIASRRDATTIARFAGRAVHLVGHDWGGLVAPVDGSGVSGERRVADDPQRRRIRAFGGYLRSMPAAATQPLHRVLPVAMVAGGVMFGAGGGYRRLRETPYAPPAAGPARSATRTLRGTAEVSAASGPTAMLNWYRGLAAARDLRRGRGSRPRAHADSFLGDAATASSSPGSWRLVPLHSGRARRGTVVRGRPRTGCARAP